MRKAKNLVGILLILASVGGLVYWEGYGRNEFMTEKVLAANETIAEGTPIKKEMFSMVSALPETLMEGAMRVKDFGKIEGKEAAQLILKNQLVSEAFLREPIVKISENKAPYTIKGHWIDSRSSSLRKGDMIRIFSRDGTFLLGDFEVAFVKDASEKEVTDVQGQDALQHAPYGRQGRMISDRTDGSGIIDHLEILTSLEEYQKILQFVESMGQTLLIVQKGDSA